MSKAHILVVEDEQDISDILNVQLTNNDYDVTVIGDGQEALEFIQKPEGERSNSTPVDLYILDRMLPNTSGLEICKFLRIYKQTKNIPILMVTAMTRAEQIVEGLDAGADDYVTKPFDINVLMARVRSLLRRTDGIEVNKENKDSSIFTLGELKVDTDQCKAFISDMELDLTLSEYKLLVALSSATWKSHDPQSIGGVYSRRAVHVTDRTIDTHIFGLRKKLKDHSKLIETIRGIGYRVAPSV